MNSKREILESKFILEHWQSIDEAHEYFNFLGMTFDINKAAGMAATKPIVMVKVDPRWSRAIPINKDHVALTDVTKPVLLGTIMFKNKPIIILIDGHHRMAHAAEMGMDELPARLLDYDETTKVLI